MPTHIPSYSALNKSSTGEPKSIIGTDTLTGSKLDVQVEFKKSGDDNYAVLNPAMRNSTVAKEDNIYMQHQANFSQLQVNNETLPAPPVQNKTQDMYAMHHSLMGSLGTSITQYQQQMSHSMYQQPPNLVPQYQQAQGSVPQYQQVQANASQLQQNQNTNAAYGMYPNVMMQQPMYQQHAQPQLNMQSVMQQSILQGAGPIWKRGQIGNQLNNEMLPKNSNSIGQKPQPYDKGVRGAITMPNLVQQAGLQKLQETQIAFNNMNIAGYGQPPQFISSQ